MLRLLIAATGFAAGSASADTFCRFDHECYEDETCAESGFTMTLTNGGATTEFGDFVVGHAEGQISLMKGPGMVILLSRGDDGAARASAHMEGPKVVTYLGRCEATQ